jgi:hypothetical protein
MASIQFILNDSKKIQFYDTYMTINEDLYNYSDIKGYTYLLQTIKRSINFIPTYTTTDFSFKIQYKDQKVYISKQKMDLFRFHTQARKDIQSLFVELAKAFDEYVRPQALSNLQQTLKNQGFVQAGSLKITARSLEYSRFMRKSLQLDMKDYHNSQFYNGRLYIYRNEAGKPVDFADIGMGEENAVLIPDLLLTLI